jgi:hypothetical protein
VHTLDTLLSERGLDLPLPLSLKVEPELELNVLAGDEAW